MKLCPESKIIIIFKSLNDDDKAIKIQKFKIFVGVI